MGVYCGTSGYAYTEWKGRFYPVSLPAKEFYAYYAARLNAVELNHTFYRTPTASQLEDWSRRAPVDFRFAVKVPMALVQRKVLDADAAASFNAFTERCAALGAHLGPLLVAFPGNRQFDERFIEMFVRRLEDPSKFVFAFRAGSRPDASVFAALRTLKVAVCYDDTEGLPWQPSESGIYARLRRGSYTRDELAVWRDRLVEHPTAEHYVFFRHDDEATGPRLAEQLHHLLSARR